MAYGYVFSDLMVDVSQGNLSNGAKIALILPLSIPLINQFEKCVSRMPGRGLLMIKNLLFLVTLTGNTVRQFAR